MGLQLKDVPSKPVTALDLDGKVVAIDAPNLVYAFYAVQMLRGGDKQTALKSASKNLANRIADLSRLGARSVVIFDGPPHALKRELLDKRNAERSFEAIGAADYAMAREAARAMGAPIVDAKHDAEAQACAMARRGVVDVVATTDWDALAMGAPALLRNLSANPDAYEGRRWSLVPAKDALAFLQTDEAGLCGAAVLMGCDYFEGLPRVGPQKALAAMRAHGTLDAALAALGADPKLAERARLAHELLSHPPEAPHRELRWLPVSTEALLAALAGKAPVKRAVRQARLD